MSTTRREATRKATSVAAAALERGAGALRALQSPSGYWWGELECVEKAVVEKASG